MYNFVKFPLVVALSVLAIAGTARAQDNFEATISQTPGANVEANYEAMEKQARRYCKKEAIRFDGRSAGVSQSKFVNGCTAELLDKAIAKFNDPVLMAYHNDQTGRKILLATAKRAEPSNR